MSSKSATGGCLLFSSVGWRMRRKEPRIWCRGEMRLKKRRSGLAGAEDLYVIEHARIRGIVRVCVGKKAADELSWLTDSFLIEISGRWSAKPAVPHAHTRSHRDDGGRPASRASSPTAQQRLFCCCSLLSQQGQCRMLHQVFVAGRMSREESRLSVVLHSSVCCIGVRWVTF